MPMFSYKQMYKLHTIFEHNQNTILITRSLNNNNNKSKCYVPKNLVYTFKCMVVAETDIAIFNITNKLAENNDYTLRIN